MGGVSFDALNKNIRETNKQKRENKEEDDEEMVRKYHVLMATWDWWWLTSHFLCMMGKLQHVSVCVCVSIPKEYFRFI